MKFRHWRIEVSVGRDRLTEIIEARSEKRALDCFARLALGEPNFAAVEKAVKEGGGELKVWITTAGKGNDDGK